MTNKPDKNVYYISTTIKKIWMDKILSGEKTSEFKVASVFWIKRLTGARIVLDQLQQPVRINFLCGQIAYKFIVKEILFHNKPMVIDGVKTQMYYEIKLGQQLMMGSAIKRKAFKNMESDIKEIGQNDIE